MSARAVIRKPSCKCGQCEACVTFEYRKKESRATTAKLKSECKKKACPVKPAAPNAMALLEAQTKTAKEIKERQSKRSRVRNKSKEAKPSDIHGPGTQLTKLFESLGITKKGGCKCGQVAAMMNQLGVAGCRKHFDRIVKQIKDGKARYTITDTIKAAALAVATGVITKINWLDPIPGLAEEAIRRAEAGEQKGKVRHE